MTRHWDELMGEAGLTRKASKQFKSELRKQAEPADHMDQDDHVPSRSQCHAERIPFAPGYLPHFKASGPPEKPVELWASRNAPGCEAPLRTRGAGHHVPTADVVV